VETNTLQGGVCFERVVVLGLPCNAQVRNFSSPVSFSAAHPKGKDLRSPDLTDEFPVRDETVLSGK